MRLRHRLPPQSRLKPGGLIPPWVDPRALLAMQFGPDRYWRKRGGLLPATSVLTTTRSSGINLPNAAGVYQTLGNNALPRTDRGLYANGQLTNTLTAPADLSDAAWAKAAGATVTPNVVTAAGLDFDRIAVAGTAGYVSQANGTAGQTVTTVVVVKKATTTQAESNLAWRMGATGFRLRLNWTGAVLSSLTVMNGTAIGTPGFLALADGAYLVWFTDTIVADANQLRLYSGQFGTDTANLDYGFVEVFESTFASDALVNGTLLASDIHAVQGTRPSDAQPEPFPGWEAAGLDDGLSVLLDFENRMQQAETRQVVSLNDASNAVVAVLNTTSVGTSFRLTAGGGSDIFPGGQTGGRSRVACRVMPDGTFALAQKGQGSVTTGTKASPINLASATRLTIGNRPQLDAPWNDWIYELQICQPLSDVELLDWVNA